jgi:uncharacterized protein YjaZ
MDTIKSHDGKIIAEIHFLTEDKKIKNKETIKIVKDTLIRCYKEIPITDKKIVIYPSEDEFVRKKMDGVTGNAIYKDIITLYISPVPGWKKAFAETLAHEYSHLAVKDNHRWETLLDSLIFEGVAEVFREEIIGGKPARWSIALDEKESRILFNKIKDKLSMKKNDIYKDLFFGSKEYKMWSGYSLGYQIMRSFRKNHSDMEWKEIISLKPKRLLDMSGFGRT